MGAHFAWGGQCLLVGVEVRGDMKLPDSQIGGGFELVGTRVLGDLDMRGAVIRGEIFSSSRVDNGPQEEVSPIVKGQVLLTRARVRVLRLHFIVPADGVKPVTLPTSVDLEHAEIGELIVSGQLPAREGPKFRFSGLRFDEINVGKLEAINSANPFVRLLDQMDPFNEGFYLQIEKWLCERGKDEEADDVYLALRRRGLDLDRQMLFNFERLGHPAKWLSGLFLSLGERLGHPVKWLSGLFLYLGRSVLFYTVADGVRVMRLFWLWVLALVCSTVLFSRRESVQHPPSFTPKSEYEEAIIARSQIPSKWAAKEKVFWTEEMGEPDSWRWTDGMWVALRVHVPLVEVFARSDWVPSDRRIQLIPIFQPIPIFYETYASYMRIFQCDRATADANGRNWSFEEEIGKPRLRQTAPARLIWSTPLTLANELETGCCSRGLDEDLPGGGAWMAGRDAQANHALLKATMRTRTPRTSCKTGLASWFAAVRSI